MLIQQLVKKIQMSIKKINPHHLDNDLNPSIIDSSLQTNIKAKDTLQQIKLEYQRKFNFLSLLIGSLYIKKLIHAFRIIKFKPLKTIHLRKKVFQGLMSLVRRSQYDKKIEGFKFIKRFFIQKKKQQIKRLSIVLQKSRTSAIKLVSILLNAKEKTNKQVGFGRINSTAKQRYLNRRQKYRKGFRIWIKVCNLVSRRYFMKLRCSRFLTERRIKVKTISKVINEYRQRSLKVGINSLKRNLYIKRENQIKSQIFEIQNRIQQRQDQQLNDLKQKQQKIQQSIAQVKREKEQISQAYQLQVKEAETKSIQIQANIQKIKSENQSLTKQISEINHKLKEQFSIDEIFQMFYNNFLLYLTKHKNASLNKTQMLQALKKPLIPINLPIDSLKEQNKVMKDLLKEYMLMYGPKSLEGIDLEIPYEYLVKENQTMYKILQTLLQRFQYNKKQVTQLRQTIDSVEHVVKQFRM